MNTTALIALTFTTLVALAAQPLAHKLEAQSTTFRIKLGEFESTGEITTPGTNGPFPTVLLVHGSTPMDKDCSVMNGTQIVSRICAQIAEHLTNQGFAVVRYNKRFVTGAGEFNSEGFYSLTLQDFLSDAQTVLAFATQQATVDAKRIFVFGWSEGSAIAAQLALQFPVHGLMLQGPVSNSFARAFQMQSTRVGLPYLQRFAKAGLLRLADVILARDADAGFLARSYTAFLLDPYAPKDAPRLNPFMDKNKDGVLDLELEVKPVFAAALRDSPNTLGPYSSALALPGVVALAPKLTNTPMLVLQGEQDANIDPKATRELQATLGNNATFLYYAGLGHSLGVAQDVFDDRFRPMAQQPLDDMAAWLLRNLK